MKHILHAAVLGLAVVAGPVAVEAGPSDTLLAPVVQQLEADGYAVVETQRSWFGRLIVLATRDGVLREVVLNRTTGAVLSDRLFNRAGTDDTARDGRDDNPGSGTSGSGPINGAGQAGRN